MSEWEYNKNSQSLSQLMNVTVRAWVVSSLTCELFSFCLTSFSEDSFFTFNVTCHFSRKAYGQYNFSFPVMTKTKIWWREVEEEEKEEEEKEEKVEVEEKEEEKGEEEEEVVKVVEEEE